MVVRINTELERIGDQAVNNCEYVEMFLSDPPARPLHDLSRMTDIACEMVHGALAAFAAEDVEMARRVVALDDQVDELNRQTFTDLLADDNDDPETVRRSMSLILARPVDRAHRRSCREHLRGSGLPGQGRGHPAPGLTHLVSFRTKVFVGAVVAAIVSLMASERLLSWRLRERESAQLVERLSIDARLIAHALENLDAVPPISIARPANGATWCRAA